MTRTTLAGLAALAALIAVAAVAGPERVALPEDYQTRFVNYMRVDRPDRKRVRFMYVNPEAAAAAAAGQPLPDGTVLIMEDHNAETDAADNPVWGTDGRMVAKPERGNVFVMQKDATWVTDNGNWDYAAYLPDGSVNAEAKLDGCFACHMSREARDFTFTYWTFVADRAN